VPSRSADLGRGTRIVLTSSTEPLSILFVSPAMQTLLSALDIVAQCYPLSTDTCSCLACLDWTLLAIITLNTNLPISREFCVLLCLSVFPFNARNALKSTHQLNTHSTPPFIAPHCCVPQPGQGPRGHPEQRPATRHLHSVQRPCLPGAAKGLAICTRAACRVPWPALIQAILAVLNLRMIMQI
jgi:hypothetical protein